jgi:hypothetical protein
LFLEDCVVDATYHNKYFSYNDNQPESSSCNFKNRNKIVVSTDCGHEQHTVEDNKEPRIFIHEASHVFILSWLQKTE